MLLIWTKGSGVYNQIDLMFQLQQNVKSTQFYSKHTSAAAIIAMLLDYSMDAYKAVQEKDVKVKALQARRQQLSSMLAEENEQYHVRYICFYINQFVWICIEIMGIS